MSDLTVTLRLVDQMTERLTGIETELGAFGKSLDSTFNTIKTIGIGIGAAFAVNAIKNATQAAIDFGDSIEHGARATGMSTEEYQKWNYVIKQSGGNIDGMGMAFKKMAQEAAAHSQILGVATRDTNGNLKSMGTLFQELVLRISEIKNPTERAAAAQQAFGRGGQEVFALASQGKEKIKELADQTEEYGLILGGDVVKRLDEAKRIQEAMNLSWKVASAEIMVNLAPAIKALLPLVTNLAQGLGWIFGGSDQAKKKQEEQQKLDANYINQLKELVALRKEQETIVETGKGSHFGLYSKESVADAENNIKVIEAEIKQVKKEYQEAINPAQVENAPSQFDFTTKKEEKYNPENNEMFGVSKALKGQVAEMQSDAKLISDLNVSLGDSFLKSLNISQEQTDRYIALQKEKMDFDIHMKKITLLNIGTLLKEAEDLYKNDYLTQEQYLEKKAELEQKAVDTAMTMGEALGNAIGTGFEKGKFKVHDALKSLLNMLVDALEKQALAAVASNTLQKIDEGGMEYGLIIGAVEAAAIMAVGSLAKSAISSFAGGTSYAPGGMAMVGERGPELMHVPRGAQIYNNQQTHSMMNSGHTFNITLGGTKSVSESLHAEVRAGDPGVQKLISILSEKLS